MRKGHCWIKWLYNFDPLGSEKLHYYPYKNRVCKHSLLLPYVVDYDTFSGRGGLGVGGGKALMGGKAQKIS